MFFKFTAFKEQWLLGVVMFKPVVGDKLPTAIALQQKGQYFARCPHCTVDNTFPISQKLGFRARCHTCNKSFVVNDH